MSSSSPTFGLALGGGGVRGLAHIGVLKALEREQIPIHFIAGTSMGGLIAAAYAAGLSPEEIEEEALRLANPRRLITFLDRSLPRRGLIQGQKVMKYLSEWLGEITFQDLRVQLALIAVDLKKGDKIVLREGKVLEAVRATMALPGVFAPVERDNQLLVDGGLLDNIPADVVRQMGADVVIAVDTSTGAEALAVLIEDMYRRRFLPDRLVGLMEVIWRSVTVMASEISSRCLEVGQPDLLLRPSIPQAVTTLTGFTHAREVISSGERAMEEALPSLRKTLGKDQDPLEHMTKATKEAAPTD
ncbi:MAG: patatin-like phospholipase family protein [Anaerolineae bacterium]|jgi:NTE family protein